MQATTDIIAGMVAYKYLDASEKPYTPKQLRNDMELQFRISLSYKKAWKTQKLVMGKQFGSDPTSYQLLPSMTHMLDHSNHGSSISLVRGVDDTFQSFFFSLTTWTDAWQFCRPLLIVDGSFMKAYYKGTLVTACGDYRSFVVNLTKKTRSCGVFQLDEFICVHGVASLRIRPGLSCCDFISPYYSRDA
ncbi:unnamed protein product [Cuscuta europaea]|uniref:Uncharacterized protein n=1 Tax=Cuscuta europaea TaxID=41803 RepID=A0A9P0ZHW4_CUSEU|nr:unnamed protein product [Cuscuta europaea]